MFTDSSHVFFVQQFHTPLAILPFFSWCCWLLIIQCKRFGVGLVCFFPLSRTEYKSFIKYTNHEYLLPVSDWNRLFCFLTGIFLKDIYLFIWQCQISVVIRRIFFFFLVAACDPLSWGFRTFTCHMYRHVESLLARADS